MSNDKSVITMLTECTATPQDYCGMCSRPRILSSKAPYEGVGVPDESYQQRGELATNLDVVELWNNIFFFFVHNPLIGESPVTRVDVYGSPFVYFNP